MAGTKQSLWRLNACSSCVVSALTRISAFRLSRTNISRYVSWLLGTKPHTSLTRPIENGVLIMPVVYPVLPSANSSSTRKLSTSKPRDAANPGLTRSRSDPVSAMAHPTCVPSRQTTSLFTRPTLHTRRGLLVGTSSSTRPLRYLVRVSVAWRNSAPMIIGTASV